MIGNFCHTSGGPPNFNFLAGQNPFFLNQGPKKTAPSAYLAGGAPFGTALVSNDPNSSYGSYLGPLIISRNLTPGLHGLPEGGKANCIPPPVDGSRLQVLQVMPWPDFQDMTYNDIEAIYQYLSAIPCNPGPAKVTDLSPAFQDAFPVLHNNCGQ